MLRRQDAPLSKATPKNRAILAPIDAGDSIVRVLGGLRSCKAQLPCFARWAVFIVSDTRDGAAEEALHRHICAIATGVEGALAELHSATQCKLLAYANRMLRDRQAAEEVVYDVYLYVWSHAHAFDPRRSTPMTWLRMLCRSRVLDRLRVKDRTTLVADFDSLVADREMECDEPSDSCATNANQRKVRHALSRLTPVHRQMLALSFFSDLSHSEIAERCVLKLGTVKSHVRRGLAALRLELAGVRDDYV